MSKSEKIRTLLAQGKTPAEAAAAVGATPTLAYKVNKEKKKPGRKAKPKANGQRGGKRSETAPRTDSVVWRAQNGGSAVFASENAARAYLGKLVKVVPVTVLS